MEEYEWHTWEGSGNHLIHMPTLIVAGTDIKILQSRLRDEDVNLHYCGDCQRQEEKLKSEATKFTGKNILNIKRRIWI